MLYGALDLLHPDGISILIRRDEAVIGRSLKVAKPIVSTTKLAIRLVAFQGHRIKMQG